MTTTRPSAFKLFKTMIFMGFWTFILDTNRWTIIIGWAWAFYKSHSFWILFHFTDLYTPRTIPNDRYNIKSHCVSANYHCIHIVFNRINQKYPFYIMIKTYSEMRNYFLTSVVWSLCFNFYFTKRLGINTSREIQCEVFAM